MSSDRDIGFAWRARILSDAFKAQPRPLADVSSESLADATGIAPGNEPDEFFDALIIEMVDDGVITTSAQQAPEGQVFDVRLTPATREAMNRSVDGPQGTVQELLDKSAGKAVDGLSENRGLQAFALLMRVVKGSN